MPAWPRDILPQASSSFVMPGALAAWGQSGKGQHRATAQIGRIWSETYPPFLASSIFGRRFLATINNLWRGGTEFTVDHRSYLTRNGTGTAGTPLVNGANQTGASLVTDGWGINASDVLRGGDIIRIAGLKPVFVVTADVGSDGSGAATLSLNPPIFAGGSPADNAALTITGVLLNAFMASAPDLPAAGPDGFIAGLTVTFREAV